MRVNNEGPNQIVATRSRLAPTMFCTHFLLFEQTKSDQGLLTALFAISSAYFEACRLT